MIAADASNNGAVSSFDASLIARTSAGIANTGIAGQWKFAPASRSYPSLTASQTAQNYDAILMGEVSGNWLAPSGSPSAAGSASAEETVQSERYEEKRYQFTGFDPVRDKAGSQSKATAAAGAQQATVNVSLPSNATASNGSAVVIPVTVGDTTNQSIFAFDFTVTFDANVLTPTTCSAATNSNTLSGTAGFTITTNPGSGTVTISGFGSQPLAGAGTLVNLCFTVVGTSGTATGTTNLTFASFVFNEGDPAAATTNGRFSVTSATAATVSVSGRVTARGKGISNAVVNLTSQSGEILTARTNRLGYYTFRELAIGETYIFNVFSKRYQFTTQVINLTEDLDELNFTAQ
jgi:hypothetical protein